MSPRLRAPQMLAPFTIRNFRFQWTSDLLASWAFEMETIILGWYVLIQTESLLLLTVFGSLQFLGTLIAPVFGLAGDRIGHRNLLVMMRISYAASASVLGLLAFTGTLSPLLVLLLAALMGLVRPADLGERAVLVGETVPLSRLMAAIGLSRITTDSARVAGALAGVGAAAFLGMDWAYAIIVGLYCGSVLLLLAVVPPARAGDAASPVARPALWSEMVEAARIVRHSPPQLAALLMAFLVNLTAFPFTIGLLPYVAREVYGTDQTGLGYLAASAGLGAVAAALLLSGLGPAVRPARMMMAFSLVWHLLLIGFGFSGGVVAGAAWLVLIGLTSGLCMLPMSVLLIRVTAPAVRGRIMGMRTLAIYGLPMGLLIAGRLIEWVGFPAVALLFGLTGIGCTLMILWRWRDALLPRGAESNQG